MVLVIIIIIIIIVIFFIGANLSPFQLGEKAENGSWANTSY